MPVRGAHPTNALFKQALKGFAKEENGNSKANGLLSKNVW